MQIIIFLIIIIILNLHYPNLSGPDDNAKSKSLGFGWTPNPIALDMV
jgi:hypothetical protein